MTFGEYLVLFVRFNWRRKTRIVDRNLPKTASNAHEAAPNHSELPRSSTAKNNTLSPFAKLRFTRFASCPAKGEVWPIPPRKVAQLA